MHHFWRNTWRIWKKWTKWQKYLDDGSYMIIVTFIQFFLSKNLLAFLNNTLYKTYQYFEQYTGKFYIYIRIYAKLTSIFQQYADKFVEKKIEQK